MSDTYDYSDYLDAYQVEIVSQWAQKLDVYKFRISEEWRETCISWAKAHDLTLVDSFEAIATDKGLPLLKQGDITGFQAEFSDACMACAETGLDFEAAWLFIQLWREQAQPFLDKEYPEAEDLAAARAVFDRFCAFQGMLLAQTYFRLYSRKIARQEIALEQSRKKMELLVAEAQQMAITDSLTDLLTHQYFITMLQHEFEKATRYNYDFCLLMIDIDGLKEINESISHEAGDQALKSVASILKTTFRKTDLMGRLSGGEFAVILFESNIDQAALAAERLRTMVQIQTSKMLGLHDSGEVTVSIGIANFFDSDSPDNLVKLSENAMSRAKADGRNRVRY